MASCSFVWVEGVFSACLFPVFAGSLLMQGSQFYVPILLGTQGSPPLTEEQENLHSCFLGQYCRGCSHPPFSSLLLTVPVFHFRHLGVLFFSLPAQPFGYSSCVYVLPSSFRQMQQGDFQGLLIFHFAGTKSIFLSSLAGNLPSGCPFTLSSAYPSPKSLIWSSSPFSLYWGSSAILLRPMNPWAPIIFYEEAEQSAVRDSESTDKARFESIFCHLLAKVPEGTSFGHSETISYVK